MSRGARDGEAPRGGRRRRDWTVWALLLLLLASLAAQLPWAAEDLTPRRFFDERHVFENVRALVMEGTVRPPNWLYPSLSYLPYTPPLAASEGLYRATGAEVFKVFEPGHPGWVSETGYLLARLVSVLAGALCVVLTYALGRRTVSPPVGLLAAALLSLAWGFLLVAIKVKPDVLVMLFTLVTVWWSLDALERPSAGRFALAGVGVGLAAAAKYYGVTAAIPLAVGALATGARRPATWGRLAIAAASSVVTFFVLNPWPDLVLRNVRFQRRAYAARGAASENDHWGMLVREGDWLLDENGIVVVVFLVLGCVGLAVRAASGRGERPGRLGALTLVSMVLGHLLFFAAATTYFTFQNFVPVDPFTSIVAAWAMVTVAEAAVRRLPRTSRAAVRALLWVPVAGLVLSIHFSRAYDAAVPTTPEAAQQRLAEMDGLLARVVYQEPIAPDLTLVSGGGGPAVLAIEDAPEAPRGLLRHADAVVFPASRLEGPEGERYSRFLESWPGPVVPIEPTWFVTRGPGIVVALGDWRPAGEPFRHPLERTDGALRIPLPEPVERGEVVSLAIEFRSPRTHLLPRSLRVGGWGEAELYALPSGGRRRWMVTRKLPLRRRGQALVLELPELPERVQPVMVELYRWRRPEG